MESEEAEDLTPNELTPNTKKKALNAKKALKARERRVKLKAAEAAEAAAGRSDAARAANGKRRRAKPFGGSEYVRLFYAILEDPTLLDRLHTGSSRAQVGSRSCSTGPTVVHLASNPQMVLI